MDTISVAATLVPESELAGVDDSIRLTLTQAELEEALAFDESAELHLDVMRDGEQHGLDVIWTQEELEQMLRTGGGEITLMFDSDDFVRAIEDDVEAHGLRQRALVLTVAVASAAVATSTAAAGTTAASVKPDAKRFHGIEITAKRFHEVGPDAKRFHGVKPQATRGGF
jgi:hypothetical protein